jgi:hypothetical protein
MALELCNRSWRLAFGDGSKRRQVSVPAADLAALGAAVPKAKERFKLPDSARILGCYETGGDDFQLHRHLMTLVERQIEQVQATRRERLQNPRSEAERSVVHRMRLRAIGPASAWLWHYLEVGLVPHGARLIPATV